ncbi:MAG: transposase [Rhodocyclaceae bacterium]|nr:transposase [Rhodocyclaceae bacterium]
MRALAVEVIAATQDLAMGFGTDGRAAHCPLRWQRKRAVQQNQLVGRTPAGATLFACLAGWNRHWQRIPFVVRQENEPPGCRVSRVRHRHQVGHLIVIDSCRIDHDAGSGVLLFVHLRQCGQALVEITSHASPPSPAIAVRVRLRPVSRRSPAGRRPGDCHPPDVQRHPLRDLIAQRLYGLCCGYEDLNDHDRLRHDPLMQTAVGKGEELASWPVRRPSRAWRRGRPAATSWP